MHGTVVCADFCGVQSLDSGWCVDVVWMVAICKGSYVPESSTRRFVVGHYNMCIVLWDSLFVGICSDATSLSSSI